MSSEYNGRENELEGLMADKSYFPADNIAAIRSLYSPRADALAAVLNELGNDSADPKARDVNDRISALLDRWILPYSHVRDKCTPYMPMFNWIEQETAREFAFFQGLMNLAIGEARDALAVLESGLNQTIKDLQYKWDTMSYSAQQIEKIEADANVEVNRILQDCIKDTTDAWARYGNALHDFLGVMVKLPDYVNDALVAAAIEAGIPPEIAALIPKISLLGKDYFAKGKELGIPAAQLAKANPELFRDPGMAVSEEIQRQFGPYFEILVGAFVNYYKTLSPLIANAYQTQLQTIQSKFPNNGAILVSFTDTRRDVDRFLKENGLDQARKIFDDVNGRLNSWVSAMPTDGLKRDAATWAAHAREPLQRRFERLANAFGMFVQANQGRFTGSVSRQVENQLIFTDVWEDRTRGILALGMDQRLVEWRKTLPEITNLFDSMNQQIGDQLRNVPSDLFMSVNYALGQYVAKLRDRVAREIETAGRTFDSAADAVKPDNLNRALDRRSLRAMLTG